MDTKVKSVQKSIDELLNSLDNDKQRYRVINHVLWQNGYGTLGSYLQSASHARCAINKPVVVGVDNKNTGDREIEQTTTNDTSYLQKVRLLDKIIDNDTWATKGRDFSSYAAETKLLLHTLTLDEIGKLDGKAFYKMIQIVRQSTCQGVTNRIAYIRAAYFNVINGVDYKKRWTLKYKLEHGEITQDEYLTRMYYLN